MSGNTPKILVAAGVILVVLFAVSVGIGANGGVPGLSVEAVVAAFENLIPSPPVALADISASPESCLDRTLQRIVIPSLGQCLLTVGASNSNVRTLTLTSDSSLRVRTTVSPAEGKTMTVNNTLPRDTAPVTRLELDIFGRGGTLLIDQCIPASGSACVIDVS